ncbi:MAG: glycosyltransferase family 4 protein [Lachnospiraceae bacterium]|nr:glycosyltransferase family 4 protein [Lachnospiraceae bacterium]
MEKIVHVCLCGPMTDGFSYQENLLSKYHKMLGYEVSIITSEWIWDEEGKLAKDKRKNYVNEHNIQVHRLSIKNNKTIEDKLKKYKGFIEVLETEKPDILFIHGCQFTDIWKVKAYVKKNPSVRVFIDNHADFSNSGTNFLSRNILHKGIWKAGAKAIEPYVEKFYGVLPARVDFLLNMYGLPKEKTELLVMGADDELIEKAEKENVGDKIRSQFGIAEEDFLIVTGGKIDRAKRQTIYLMEAVKKMQNPQIKLLLFGSVEEELKSRVEELQDGKRIIFAGWISAVDSYDYFAAADLVCFPGRHSVFWEQAAGQGIPMIVKHWEGTEHVDIGGNVRFLYEDSTEEIGKVLKTVTDRAGSDYRKMKEIARTRGKEEFSYREIAKRAVSK